MGAVAAGTAAVPLVSSMNPAADTLALATAEVDLSHIEEGQRIVAVWRGKPIFIDRRSDAEMQLVQKDEEETDWHTLRDPQSDAMRVKEGHGNWLVMIGICTHLGCIPKGSKPGDPRGDFGGWFCPCHGSQYDRSGRIRKGPAPKNLEIPPYQFVSDTLIRIG
jgi:ubiquinol-cytochrome c reductase iron-sulfur subunit